MLLKGCNVLNESKYMKTWFKISHTSLSKIKLKLNKISDFIE